MIEEMISKNWTDQFCQWYKDQLMSLYLHNIDSNHIKAEYLSILSSNALTDRTVHADY